MKKIYCISFLCISCTFLNAQRRPLYHELSKVPRVQNYQEIDLRPMHFGFSLGINTMDFTIKQSLSNMMADSLFADVPKLYPGFNINIITDFRIADYWSVRFLPGLIFGQRNIVYWKNGEKVDADMKLESNLLDFPIMIKYKAKRIQNYRPYAIAGGSIRVDMAAKKKYDESEAVFVKLKKLDYYYEVGLGIDYYLEYFKFSTELKLSVGLRDILTDTPEPRHPEYVRGIERMFSNVLQFSMHFE